MSLDRLKEAWQARPIEAAFNQPKEVVMSEIRSRMERFHRLIFWRDVRETIAAFAGAGAFALFFVWTQDPLKRAGSAILIAASLLIIAVLHATRKTRVPGRADQSVAEYLRAEIVRVDRQIRLLRSVLWWYVGPITLGVVVFLAGTVRSTVGATISGAIAILLGFIVWRLNQKAVRTELMPLREDLGRMLAGLGANGAA